MGTNTSLKLNDIARLAGVSRSTVSRVVNNDPRVSDEVRQRVQETIADVGYQPHAAARALASRRAGIIGLVIPEEFGTVYADPWFPPLVQACLTQARQTDLSVMLLMESLNDPQGVETLLHRFIRARRVDGLILSNSLVNDLLTPKLKGMGFPYVLVGRPISDGCNFVDISNREASQKITTHLLDHGWRRPAMINGSGDILSALDRRDGFLDAVRDAGIDPDSVPIVSVPFSQPGAYSAALELLTRDDRPDCIFAASDFIALGVIDAARKLNLRVPDDLGVAGFDDIMIDRNERRGLTTVHQPVVQMGATAVQMLNDLIHNRIEPPIETWLETTLSLRRTCGCGARVTDDAAELPGKEGAIA